MVVSTEQNGTEGIADDDLTRAALAADPDPVLGDDAVDFWELTGAAPTPVLGDWYMATPVGGGRRVHGWRRRVVLLVIVAFLVIDAYGLCNTYGWVAFG